MLHLKIYLLWSVGSFVMILAQGVPSSIMEAAKEGGTFGAQVLLFLGLIALGLVVISLDKRRELARTEERKEMLETRAKELASAEIRHQETLKHHDDFVAFVRQERSATESDRVNNQKILIQLVVDATKQSAATQCAMLSLEDFLKESRSPQS